METIAPKRNTKYCATCYGDAEKKGRAVKLTKLYDYPVCTLCESRLREGLVHYIPSCGGEGANFQDRCYDCRHHIPDLGGNNDPQFPSLTPPYGMCTWGILDRLEKSAWEDHDHIASWYNPADLDAKRGRCLRYTPKDYPGDDRDPPPIPDPNQLTFDDLLTPKEVAPDSVLVFKKGK